MESTELEEPAREVPMRLAALHRRTPVGRTVAVSTTAGAIATRLSDLLVGAGFSVDSRADGALHATRLRSLPDTVGPGMRVLVCGLNPSEYAADAGVGFARPGNRFWPAARAAGLVSLDRDADDAFARHGLGMTDLVKRATVRADELSAREYRAGLARVGRLVAWLRPGVVCFVGLAGWRAAVDRGASAGVQHRGLGGCRVYLMPSTSGRNAHVSLDDLVGHLRAACAPPGREHGGPR